MAKVSELGPLDHGRILTLEEYQCGRYREGFRYELIHGKLYVYPFPEVAHAFIESWLWMHLVDYSQEHPEVINYVMNKAVVIVPGSNGLTRPEPDITVYHDARLDDPYKGLNWSDVSPLLICEVMSLDDPDKDRVRNVELYWQVPSIREYWLVDITDDPEHPTMRVYRRSGRKWRITDLSYRDCYTTKLLPGFELVIDPRR